MPSLDLHHRSTDSIIADEQPKFPPEPGSSLATAIAEQRSSSLLGSNEKQTKTFTPIASVLSETSNKDSEVQSLNESENLKYKTELCRNFSTYGSCSYSSRCQFAHGYEELRCRTRHPKYKTELCRNFLAGHCKYGSRCQFLHSSEPNKDTSTELVYPTAATLGTYLLTNMLAQSAVFGFGGSMAHQGKVNCAVGNHSESVLQRTAMPFQCGIEMQQSSAYPRLHFYHELPISQNQNHNEPRSSPTDPQSSASNTHLRRMGKPSAHF